MLSIISLKVIESIFTCAEKTSKISSMAKMLYVNSLMYAFKDKKAEKENSLSFYIDKSEIKKYKSFEKYFNELEEVGLIEILDESIFFINRWNVHIDLSLYNSLRKETALIKKASQYKEKMISDKELSSFCFLKHGIISIDYVRFVELFCKERDLEEQLFISYPKLKTSFIRYLSYSKSAFNADRKTKEEKTFETIERRKTLIKEALK